MMRVLVFMALVSLCWSFEERPDVHYYAQVSGGFHIPFGDLNGQDQISVDTTGDNVAEIVYLFQPSAFALGQVRLGAHIDANTVSVGLTLGKPTMSYRSGTSGERVSQVQWQAVDFEYQRHFLLDNAWRPSMGLGYGFTRLNVPNASDWQNSSGNPQSGEVLYSGTGPHALFALGYYGWGSLVLGLESRVSLFSVSHLTTEPNDFSALSESLWEWGFGMVLSVQYVF